MYLLRNIRAAYILLLYIISYQMQAYSKRHSINLFCSNEFKINWRYFRFQMNNMCQIMRWRVVVHSDNTNIWNIFKWWSTASMTKWTASLSIYYIVKNQNEFACAKAKTKRRNFQSQWQWNLTFDNLYLRIWVFNFYFCWGHWYETWSHFNRYVCVCDMGLDSNDFKWNDDYISSHNILMSASDDWETERKAYKKIQFQWIWTTTLRKSKRKKTQREARKKTREIDNKKTHYYYMCFEVDSCYHISDIDILTQFSLTIRWADCCKEKEKGMRREQKKTQFYRYEYEYCFISRYIWHV